MGTICLLMHKSTCELPHICKLSSARREAVCGYLTRAQCYNLGAMMVLAQESSPGMGSPAVYPLDLFGITYEVAIMCGAGPGGLKFLVISSGILWYLGYFLPMFSALTGVDRKIFILWSPSSILRRVFADNLGSLGIE